MNETDMPPDFEPLWQRLLFMIVIGVMIGFTSTILWVVAAAQFIIMLFNKRRPNDQLAEFGTTMGVWVAKAIRYQTAASEVKPWPWTELD